MRLLIAGLLVRVQSGEPDKALTSGDASRASALPTARAPWHPSGTQYRGPEVPVGRPPLPLGTSGTILFATMPNGRVKARVKFRDWDGEVRLVSKTATSR